MVASHDLERLQRLLEDAGEALMGHFYGASNQMNVLKDEAPKVNLDIAPIREAMQSLAGAITALQFQDMATQLIAHTQRRLRNCADRIARETAAPQATRALAAPRGEARARHLRLPALRLRASAQGRRGCD